MLSLRRPSHKNNAIKVLFSSIAIRNEEKKINEETKYQKEQMAYQLVIWFKSNVTCGLVYFCQDRETMGESLKLPSSFLFLRLFVIDI